MGLRTETRHFPFSTQRWKASGGDLQVCALYLEDVIPYTVDVRGPGLDEAVGQFPRVPYLVPFSFSVFLVAVSTYWGPGNLPLGHDPRESGQDGSRVLRHALTIQSIAGGDDGVGLLGIGNFARKVEVRLFVWGNDGVATSASGDRGCKTVAWRIRNPPSWEKCRRAARGGVRGLFSYVSHRRGFDR